MTPAEKRPPARLSRFEANLQEILRFFLRDRPLEVVSDLLLEERAAPPCLSGDAVRLTADALRKGTTGLLAKAGGWRRERHLRGGAAVHGRLWERSPPGDLGLVFSCSTLDFLVWVTATKLDGQQLRWWTPERSVTLGDQLFLYYAYGGLRRVNLLAPPARHWLFNRHPLCRLMWPEDFNQLTPDDRPDFKPWTEGASAWILEALATELTERWVEVERQKGLIGGWQVMQAVGRSQTQTLESLFDAAETAGRRDLVRFLQTALARILTEDATPGRWLDGLTDRGATMQQRTETVQLALALPRQVARLRIWAQQARAVAFFDEDYAASQLYKSDWERCQGDALAARAAAIIRESQPL